MLICFLRVYCWQGLVVPTSSIRRPGFDSRSGRFGWSVFRLGGDFGSLLPTVNWVLAIARMAR